MSLAPPSRPQVMLAFNAPYPEVVLQIGAVLSSLSLDFALVDPVCAGIPSDAYSKVPEHDASPTLLAVLTLLL